MANQIRHSHLKTGTTNYGKKEIYKMDVRTDRELDAAALISALLLWSIKSYFDIWNSAS